MYPEPQLLVHLCSQREWNAAREQGELRPASFEDLGFVHLSTRQQVHLPANRLFAGRTDLVLLCLDPHLLDAPVRWEPGLPTDPAGMVFPHLYGPIPAGAVVDVEAYRPDPEGRFAPLIHRAAGEGGERYSRSRRSC